MVHGMYTLPSIELYACAVSLNYFHFLKSCAVDKELLRTYMGTTVGATCFGFLNFFQ